jgi:hypothetical protein
MYAPCDGIYQRRQSLDIGRKQLLYASVLQYHIDNAVLARKALQILLVGAELTCLGHLGLVGDAHLGKQHLA